MIRHGLPVRVEHDDGTWADPELDDGGHLQARRVGDWLANEAIDRIYSSPMRRAVQTAQPLSSKLGLPVETVEGVAEFDRKASAYVPLEVLRAEDEKAYRKRMGGAWDYGEHDAEGFQRVVVEAVCDIIDDNRGRRVAIFCHGGVINMWTASVLGIGAKLFFPADYTGISRYRIKDRDTRTLVTLNETPHLRDL